MRFAMVSLLLGLLAVLLFGAMTLAWTWGPALLCLGLALAATTACRPSYRFSRVLTVVVFLASLWLAWVMLNSPVAEDARTDAVLALAALATAWTVARFDVRHPAFVWLPIGLSVLVLINAALAFAQWFDPSIAWPRSERPEIKPSGLFGHYNYFANFIIGCGLFCAPRIVFSGDRAWQRTLYALALLSVVVAVPLSGSRGGLLGLLAGGGVMFGAAAMVAWRTRRRGVLIAAGIAPVICLLGFLASWKYFRGTESEQITNADVRRTFDNSSRIDWYDVALRAISDHPFTGGGSRSISWERNFHWELSEHGVPRENEPFVHNETLQLTTDYGLVGLLLVGGTVLTVVCLGVASLVLGGEKDSARDLDPISVGILAALAGMLVQSNFSFVFHLMPSVLLLGIWLGLGGKLLGKPRAESAGGRFPSQLAAGVLACVILGTGVACTAALAYLWPVLGRRDNLLASRPTEAWDRLEQASRWWPSWRIAQIQANTARRIADRSDLDAADRWKWYGIARESYADAIRRHPLNAALRVNYANTLSILREDREAEHEFEKALELEGHLESVFNARYYYALHLHDAALREWNERRSGRAMAMLMAAQALMAEALEEGPIWTFPRDFKPLGARIAKVKAFLDKASIRPDGWQRPTKADGKPNSPNP
ncbi:O-antigen ligase family protein [Haloferula sargassicola]|uniref:O-antigen ligase-related domain-containing protein n=1 Tax=Haloferula sargassicola TaxID=490096 RepID=A0ABP9UQ44_9BACT